jgi:hypothetical protein
MTEFPNESSSQHPDREGAKNERRAATDGTKEELLHVVRGRLEGAGRYINPRTGQGYVVRDYDRVPVSDEQRQALAYVKALGDSGMLELSEPRPELRASIYTGKVGDLKAPVVHYEFTTNGDGGLDLDAYRRDPNREIPKLKLGNPDGDNMQRYKGAQERRKDSKALQKASGLSTVSEADTRRLIEELSSEELKLG